MAASLVEELQKDPTITNRALSQRLGGNVATVSSLLRRLIDDRVVRVVGVSGAQAMGYNLFTVMFIKVRNRSARQVGEELVNIPEVISIGTIFGEFDLYCLTASRDQDDLRKLITHKISRAPDISVIQCNISLQVVHLRSSWGLLATEKDLERNAHHTRALLQGVDEIDQKILRMLQADGRTTKRAIAQAIGVVEGTVRYRLNEMEKKGLLTMRTIVNPARFAVNSFAVVGVDANPARIEQVAKSLSKLECVPFLAITAGRYNIIASVAAHDRSELASIVEHQLLGIAGIESTQTFEMIRAIKHNFSISYAS